jgi:hypothetical protein
MNKIKESEELLTKKERDELENEISENWTHPREAYWIPLKNIYDSRDISAKLCMKIYLQMEDMLSKKIDEESGFEFWININKKQELHCDCDEVLRQQLGLMNYPTMSAVYYHETPKEKGKLVTYQKASHNVISKIYSGQKLSEEELGEEKKLEIKKNKLIIFVDRMPHYVESWTKGDRISVAANLWKTKPREKDKPFRDIASFLKQ